jgi:hypothetical protein
LMTFFAPVPSKVFWIGPKLEVTARRQGHLADYQKNKRACAVMPMFREQSERERNIAAQIIIVSMRAADPLRQRIKRGVKRRR